jgi:hypothetical protein
LRVEKTVDETNWLQSLFPNLPYSLFAHAFQFKFQK